MDDKKHEGWTNFETWAVATWLKSDHKKYRYWYSEARWHREESPQCKEVREGIWSLEDAARRNMADQIQREITQHVSGVGRGAYAELLDAALGNVNWEEIAEHYLQKVKEATAPFGPVIFNYSRAQAIADGALVDITDTAREAGIRFHTAVTEAVWRNYVAVPAGVAGQDELGRLWDIIWMLRFAILRDTRKASGQINFQLVVRNDNRGVQEVTLKAQCGPGDDAEPVITIMLPHED